MPQTKEMFERVRAGLLNGSVPRERLEHLLFSEPHKAMLRGFSTSELLERLQQALDRCELTNGQMAAHTETVATPTPPSSTAFSKAEPATAADLMQFLRKHNPHMAHAVLNVVRRELEIARGIGALLAEELKVDEQEMAARARIRDAAVATLELQLEQAEASKRKPHEAGHAAVALAEFTPAPAPTTEAKP
jgi:hypothetical protein